MHFILELESGNSKTKQLSDDIPSTYIDKFESISKETWKHEDFRKKVIGICIEQQNTQEFMNRVWNIVKDFLRDEAFSNKVKQIAGTEVKNYIDKSRVKTIFWIAALIVTIVTGVIGIVLQKYFHILG